MKDVKQVIVIRRDLKMRRGKECAQAAHACLATAIKSMNSDNHNSSWNDWVNTGTTKICLRVNSEEELVAVYETAKAAKLLVSLITDAGRTEFKGVPTKTCLAIGPAPSDQIDRITGTLELM